MYYFAKIMNTEKLKGKRIADKTYYLDSGRLCRPG
jgi:hypothetical protein